MPDLPANNTTTASVAIGGSYSDLIELSLDRDWIAVDLVAGQTYQFTLVGNTGDPIDDPYLELYSPASTFITFDDDNGPGITSLLTYTATQTGTFYLDIGTFGAGDTGGYTVAADIVAPPVPLDSLDWGTQVADTTVTVYFALAGETFDGITSEGFNAYEISRFQAAFDLLEAVSGLTFTIQNTTVGADFNLVLDTNENGGAYLGYFNPPGTTNEGVGVFAGNLWDRVVGGSLDAGGYDMVTILHELGHGLGMAHPHDTGGTSGVMNGVTADFDDYGDFDLNQGIFTTMSYNTGYATGTPGSGGDPGNDFGYEYGPMAFDIALLQQKYGANATTNAGNTVYVLDSANAAGTYWQAIWDVSGDADEIRQDGSTGATIDLRTATLAYEVGGGGFVSAVSGIAGGFTIAAGVAIERATGGSGADVLIGNAGDNVLTGRGGADSLQGGGGQDTARYGDSATGVTVRLWNGSGAGGDAAGDTLTGIEDLIGSAQGDLLIGGLDVANSLSGGGGADFLDGLTGADRLDGGSGTDTAGYSGSATGVIVRLWNGTGTGGAAQGDLLTGIENLIGSAHGDQLLGALDVANSLSGGGGADFLDGLTGADRLDGGTGTDTAGYSGSATGVTVRLWNGTGTGGAAQGDLLTGIENLIGSAHGDLLLGADLVGNRLTGGAGSDYLNGLSGNDTLLGDAGIDILDGGAGNDILTGGADGDRFLFGTGSGADRVTLFEDGFDQVDLQGALTFAGVSLTSIAGGVRVGVIATPADTIDLIGVTLGQVTPGDFV